jgi:hypothetical protein
MAIGAYLWLLIAVILMSIGDYFINGYWCIFVVINNYYINEYWWLFYSWLLVDICGY